MCQISHNHTIQFANDQVSRIHANSSPEAEPLLLEKRQAWTDMTGPVLGDYRPRTRKAEYDRLLRVPPS